MPAGSGGGGWCELNCDVSSGEGWWSELMERAWGRGLVEQAAEASWWRVGWCQRWVHGVGVVVGHGVVLW